jgi:putative hydrolase of the HAD superfamily
MIIFFDIAENLIDQRWAEAAAAQQFLAAYLEQLDQAYSVGLFCALWRDLREKHSHAFLSSAISVHEQHRRRVRDLFALAGRSLLNIETDHCIEIYEYQYRQSWCLFDDVIFAWAALKQFRCCTISNGSSIQQIRKLQQTGIARYVEGALVSGDVGTAKPQPGILLAACRSACAAPKECIHGGDRLDYDTLPSRKLVMRAYWLCRGERPAVPDVEVIGELSCHLTGRSAG